MAVIIGKIPDGLYQVCADYLGELLSKDVKGSLRERIALRLKLDIELIIAMYIEGNYSVPCLNTMAKVVAGTGASDILTRYHLAASEPLEITLPNVDSLSPAEVFVVKVIDRKHFALKPLRLL